MQESDLVGIFHILLEEPYRPNYFKTLNRLRPLFKSEEFKKNITGCYVIHDRVDDKDTLRTKYFTPPSAAKAAKKAIKEFIKDSGLAEHKSISPKIEKVSAGNCGKEFSFRRFLALVTCIGLELTENAKLEEIDFLMHKFREQNPRRSKNRGKSDTVSSLLEPTLERYSETFRSLKESKPFLWGGLSNHKCDWPHFFVGLVCGVDVNY